MDENEVKRKRPVWAALAKFFLDTELDEDEIARIADVVTKSGFSLEEVKVMLVNELFPALFFNLQSVAGEWEEFPEDWLVERILQTRPPSFLKRVYFKMQFWMVKRYWLKLAEFVQ